MNTPILPFLIALVLLAMLILAVDTRTTRLAHESRCREVAVGGAFSSEEWEDVRGCVNEYAKWREEAGHVD